MTINEKALQIKKMALLVSREQTGNARQFAEQIEISRSKLYDLIEEFRLMGVEIRYSKRFNTFYYANDKKIKVNTPIEILSINEHQCINGGWHYSSVKHPTVTY